MRRIAQAIKGSYVQVEKAIELHQVSLLMRTDDPGDRLTVGVGDFGDCGPNGGETTLLRC